MGGEGPGGCERGFLRLTSHNWTTSNVSVYAVRYIMIQVSLEHDIHVWYVCRRAKSPFDIGCHVVTRSCERWRYLDLDVLLVVDLKRHKLNSVEPDMKRMREVRYVGGGNTNNLQSNRRSRLQQKATTGQYGTKYAVYVCIMDTSSLRNDIHTRVAYTSRLNIQVVLCSIDPRPELVIWVDVQILVFNATRTTNRAKVWRSELASRLEQNSRIAQWWICDGGKRAGICTWNSKLEG